MHRSGGQSAWPVPPSDIELLPGDVHLWRIPLDAYHSQMEPLARLLSGEERERARHFYRPVDRTRYIVAHAALRSILGTYLRESPPDIPLERGRFGKPEVAGGTTMPDLHFNLSHSGDLALVAVSQDRHVGVDVELVTQESCDLAVANHLFSPNETETLNLLGGESRMRTFFRYWTHKEAYLKGRGEGLSLPLSEVDVSELTTTTAAILTLADETGRMWSIQAVMAAEQYEAAVAVEGRDFTATQWQWSASEPRLR